MSTGIRERGRRPHLSGVSPTTVSLAIAVMISAYAYERAYAAPTSCDADALMRCSCSNNNGGDLDIDCSNRGLTQVPLPIPIVAAKLNLSNNGIGTIPAGTFSGLTNLKELDLSYNSITTLHEFAFIGLQSLLSLNLNGNAIRYDESGYANSSIARLQRLERLYILTDRCPARYPDFIVDGLRKLSELAISYPQYGSFGDAMRSLVSLDTLYVNSGCGKRRLSRDDLATLFDLPIRRLSLRGAALMHVDPDAFQLFNRTLRKLDISCNGIDNVPDVILGLRGIKLDTLLADYAVMSFMAFELNDETIGALKSMNLSILSIANNALLKVDVPGSPSELRPMNLQYLRIGYNQLLLNISKSRDLFFPLVPLVYNLRVFDVSGLLNFYNGRFVNCSQEDTLFSDALPYWISDAISYRPTKMPLWLWSLLAITRALMSDTITLPPMLTRLYARDIGASLTLPLTCSSHKIYEGNNLQIIDGAHTHVSEIDCNVSGFINLKTFSGNNMNLMRYNPPIVSTANVPLLERLNLGYNKLGKFFGVNASSPLSTSSQVKYVDLSYNGIDRLPRDFIDHCESLVMLNLSGNSLDRWAVSIGNLTHLKTIDLSDNQLTTIEKEFREQLDSQLGHSNGTIFLRNVICTCDSYDFLVWSKLTNVTLRDLTCAAGGVFQDVPSVALLWLRCYGINAIYLVSCLCLILILLVLGQRFKWRLRYIYYKSKRYFRHLTDSWHADDVRVYLAHHETASEQAAIIRDFLLHGMQLCNVVTRESFVIGACEYEEIASHIDSSHVVVLLISPNEVADPKTEFEFHMSLAKGVQCILPIMMTDVIVYERLPSTLKKLLTQNSHLFWTLSSGVGQDNSDVASCPGVSVFFTILEAYVQNLIRRHKLHMM